MFWVWRSFSRTLTFCIHSISTHSCHIEVWLRCCTAYYKLWLSIRNNFTYNHRSFQSRSGNMTMWHGDWMGLINNFWSQLQVLVPMYQSQTFMFSLFLLTQMKRVHLLIVFGENLMTKWGNAQQNSCVIIFFLFVFCLVTFCSHFPK